MSESAAIVVTPAVPAAVDPAPSGLMQRVAAAFTQHYGAAPAVLARAPGRVNLIGEHTDYNDGFVLPCAIDYQTVIAARLRSDRQVRVQALDMQGATDLFGLDAPMQKQADGHWANYVRGMLQALQQDGWPVPGMDLSIAGDVPQGAGLSSSASLEVAVAETVRRLAGLQGLMPERMAVLAQQAENRFVGCQCGIMDQLISARGEEGHALLIDCRSLAAQAVHLPDDVAVLIAQSRVQRGLVESEYNSRRLQCEAAARHYGVAALRDLDLASLQARRGELDGCTFRRARHIVTENQRTLDAADALRTGDLTRMGRLMAASHASMRDDFEITVPAIDDLVEILARAIGTEGGARMTGGGFGGCVVALMPRARVPGAMAAVAQQYRSPQGLPSLVYVCHPCAGASSLTLPADDTHHGAAH